MANDDDGHFDDPALRTAIRRACGKDAAPAGLRDRVTAMFVGGAAGGPSSLRMPVRGWRPFPTLAAAALVLLGVGLIAVEVREYYPATPPHSSYASLMPASLTAAMIKTHDTCGAQPDHHRVPGDDFRVLAAKLAAEEKVTVSATSLGNDWTFRGAGLCDVGGVRTA